MNRQIVRWINITAALLCSGLPAVCVLAQGTDGGAQTPQRIGTMTRHGLAGVVKSVTGAQVVMGISENVDFTVQIGPSTRVSDLGQDATPEAIHEKN